MWGQDFFFKMLIYFWHKNIQQYIKQAEVIYHEYQLTIVCNSLDLKVYRNAYY